VLYIARRSQGISEITISAVDGLLLVATVFRNPPAFRKPTKLVKVWISTSGQMLRVTARGAVNARPARNATATCRMVALRFAPVSKLRKCMRAKM
jgi:hypothetical protein